MINFFLLLLVVMLQSLGVQFLKFLRIDNSDFHLIGLRFTFWMISLCLSGPSERTIRQIKAEILDN